MSEQQAPYTVGFPEVIVFPEHELVYQFTIAGASGYDHCYGCPDCGETALLHRAGLEHPRRWGKPGRCSALGGVQA